MDQNKPTVIEIDVIRPSVSELPRLGMVEVHVSEDGGEPTIYKAYEGDMFRLKINAVQA